MRPFDHVLILYSFVFALALTHLLSRVGSLMLARKRVRLSGLQAFMVVNAIVLVFVNWLALWFVHDIPEWNLFSIAIYFLFALCSYFFCAAAIPRTRRPAVRSGLRPKGNCARVPRSLRAPPARDVSRRPRHWARTRPVATARKLWNECIFRLRRGCGPCRSRPFRCRNLSYREHSKRQRVKSIDIFL
jgi:hypothetical protein